MLDNEYALDDLKFLSNIYIQWQY